MNKRPYHLLLLVGALGLVSPEGVLAQDSDDESRDFSEYEGYVIKDVVISTVDVFNTDSEAESHPIFKLANRLHVDTRPRTVRSQLLFESGEELSAQKVEESERLLRNKPYLFDASITPVENTDGTVDLHVETRDNWTLFPEIQFSVTGGESESAIGIEEDNLWGTGTRLNIRRENDEDRNSSVFELSGQDIGKNRLNAAISIADLSDGESQLLRVQRPFFSLDTTWAAGTTLLSDDRIETLYSFGEQGARFRDDQLRISLFGGVSEGLIEGRTTRWILGYEYNEQDFEIALDEGLVNLAPEDRRLSFPFIRYQSIEDRFVKTSNLNQIERTEDITLGATYDLTLGYASETLDSDRNAWILGASYGRGYGSPDSLLVLFNHGLSTRLESGDIQNAVLSSRTEVYKRQSDKRVLFGALNLRVGQSLDLDNFASLGGDAGLRGYPQNFLNAETTALLTIEQRFYTEYYPLRLLRVGGAIFADIARGWGPDPIGLEQDEVLANVGFGLRLGSPRSSSNRVFHLDIAFPLTANDDLDSVQIQFSSQRRF